MTDKNFVPPPIYVGNARLGSREVVVISRHDQPPIQLYADQARWTAAELERRAGACEAKPPFKMTPEARESWVRYCKENGLNPSPA